MQSELKSGNLRFKNFIFENYGEAKSFRSRQKNWKSTNLSKCTDPLKIQSQFSRKEFMFKSCNMCITINRILKTLLQLPMDVKSYKLISRWVYFSDIYVAIICRIVLVERLWDLFDGLNELQSCEKKIGLTIVSI